MINRVGIVAACLAFVLSMHAPQSAAEMREEHGKTDVFAAQGVTLAWGVLRGATEAKTQVVIRIAADRNAYRAVTVTGRDPFTQAERPIFSTTYLGAAIDVRIPRAHFAEFPRTELRFYEALSDSPSLAPRLLVFYLGVPDTTPEFESAPRLDAYLDERIAKGRDSVRR